MIYDIRNRWLRRVALVGYVVTMYPLYAFLGAISGAVDFSRMHAAIRDTWRA